MNLSVEEGTAIKDLDAKTTVEATDELAINDVAGGNADKKEGLDDIKTFMSSSPTLVTPALSGTSIADDIEIVGGLQHTLLTKHFTDYFDYATVTSNVPDGSPYQFTNVTGSNTGTMFDGIDEGYRLTTAATSNAQASLSFNDIRHYDLRSSTMYAIVKYDNSGANLTIGVGETDTINTTGTETYGVQLLTTNTNIALTTSTGSAKSSTETDIALSTGLVIFKIISDATNVRLFLQIGGAWVLKVTKTTNLPPANKGELSIIHNTLDSTATTADLIYWKVQND